MDKCTASDRPYAVGQRDRTERICVRKGIFSDLRHRRAAQHAGHNDVSFRAGIGDQPRFAVAQVERKAALRLYDACFGCAVFGAPVPSAGSQADRLSASSAASIPEARRFAVLFISYTLLRFKNLPLS